MKPFNLERALAGDPVVTRDGRTVTEIYHFKTCTDTRPVTAVIDGFRLEFSIGGLFKPNVDHDAALFVHYADLFMAPKKRTVWVNFYPQGDATWNTTESTANHCGLPSRLGNRADPVEVEE